MTAAVAVAATFQMLDISKLEESTLNPRKHFDETKQAELNASVAAKGVLEPILVRPAGKGFEVVAGARRFRAAQAAAKAKEGPKQVPCMVRELSDVEALELATVENVQRDGLSAMDEGDAYRQLLKLGRTVEQLVEKTGRSRTVVFRYMKLAELQGEARELVLSGEWSPSIGELIARLPTPEGQLAAMERLKRQAMHWNGGVASITYRDAKNLLDREFVLQLKEASFDVKDAALVPAAGACTACPKRTHTPDNRELYKDVKVDTCLDAPCWSAKKTAAFNLLQLEVEANGKKLVKEEQLFVPSYMSSTPNTFTTATAEKYSKPTDKVAGTKTWKDLLGDEVPGVVVLDNDDKTHKLVDRKAALELLKKKDPKAAAKLKVKPKSTSSSSTDKWRAKQRADGKKFEAKRQARRVAHVKLLGAVTKLDVALNLLLEAWSVGYEWADKLAAAGLPAKSKYEQLKPAERTRLIVSESFSLDYDLIAKNSKLAKVDLKKLEKKALAATAGTCFACEKPAPDKETLCVACGLEDD